MSLYCVALFVVSCVHHVSLSFQLSASVIQVGSLSVVMPTETGSVSLSTGVVMEKWIALTR